MKHNWSEPDGYLPNKDEFDQPDSGGWLLPAALYAITAGILIVAGFALAAM